METLHDMLKREPSHEERNTNPSDDLGRRYSKIGISAVAAAAPYNCGRDTKATHAAAMTADRSSARGWSRHR
ncbi:MAG: hypothetical protein ACXWJW_04625 [Xanthobacteraceae bacterium]